jgi:myo-inositol-1(or 4)-monophosphatase
MELDLAAIVPWVRRLVSAQGAVVLDRWSAAVPLAHKDRRDIVTAVDLEVERNLKAALAVRFPGHGLSGEETEDDRSGAEYQWLIDPIDGTKYYAGQSSLFAISVGLLFRGEPVLGVIYNAPARQCFYAWRGGGAYLDGQRLSGPSATDLSRVIANVDTPATHRLSDAERRWFEDKLIVLTRRLYRVRALGLGSLAACWLASGALDAYVDLTGHVKPQDLAAGRVLMAEAGGRVEEIDPGVGPRRLLAAPPGIWEELREILLE